MEKDSVQALDRAFELLELLCKSQGGMTIQQLSGITGLHKSTVHRLLRTMIQWGYVWRLPEEAIYRPGMKLCEMSDYIQENLDIVGLAKETLRRLSQRISETVHLVTREGTEIVYIHKVECSHGSIRMASRIGMHRPMYCTSVGKAILAASPREEIECIWDESDIQAYTPNTIVDKDIFMGEIDSIRRQGYAVDNEENELGVYCIAAAVPDWRNRTSYAISVSIPVSRMTEGRKETITASLLEAKDEISAALGGHVQERNTSI